MIDKQIMSLNEKKLRDTYITLDNHFGQGRTFSASKAARVLGVSVDTARKRLVELYQIGLLDFDAYKYSASVTYYNWFIPTYKDGQ